MEIIDETKQDLPNATTVQVVGILALVLFWVYGIVGLVLGIIAWIMGNIFGGFAEPGECGADVRDYRGVPVGAGGVVCAVVYGAVGDGGVCGGGFDAVCGGAFIVRDECMVI